MRKKALFAVLVAGLLGAGGTPARAGLATAPIGRLTGELAVTGEDGVRQASAATTVSYDAGTKTGSVRIEIQQGTVKVTLASARFTAETEGDAAGAPAALALALTGREPNGRSSLQLSAIRFEGDSKAFAGLASAVIAWSDAQANLTFDNYVSPAPSLANLGKLQLNGWGIASNGSFIQSLAIVLFDTPGHVAGGSVEAYATGFPAVRCDIVSGSLVDRSSTPTPGDYDLLLELGGVSLPCSGEPGAGPRAILALDVLADGTIDVRGLSLSWLGIGRVTLEGTGNTKFVVPSGQ